MKFNIYEFSGRTRAVGLKDDALDGRMEQRPHRLDRDAGKEAQKADVAVELRMNAESFDTHWTENRAEVDYRKEKS